MIAEKSSRVIGIFLLRLLCYPGFAESYRHQLNYTIEDSVAAGVTVGQIGFDSELVRTNASSTFTFSLMASHRQPPRSRGLFNIDPTVGRLYTGSSVDRDVICAGRAQCVVELTVQARGTGRSVTITFVKVVIRVADTNDNPPTFDSSEAEVDVSEAAPAGTRVAMLPRASDVDSPPNGVRRYFIAESASRPGVFTVDYDESDTSGDVYLVAQAGLDREQVDSYSFVLVAVDGGSPALSGSVSIRVRVTDVDDNSPVFERSVYHVGVSEDAETGSRITAVHAVDADLGANGEVVYSIVRNADDDFDQLPFQINSTSGLISTSGPLDYESRSEYTLRIRAASRWGINSGSLSLAAHAQVVVHVTDVNDNSPTVVIATLHHGNCSSCSHVFESLPPKTFVAHVAVVDVDPVNGQTECQLNNDNFRLEKLFDDEYQVSSAHTDSLMILLISINSKITC